MTDKNSNHASYVASRIHDLLLTKYLKGQEEHGGDLSRKATHGHMMEEHLDNLVYLVVHLDHLEDIRTKLKKALWLINHSRRPTDTPEAIISAVGHYIKESLNILDIGNPEGVEEEERQ